MEQTSALWQVFLPFIWVHVASGKDVIGIFGSSVSIECKFPLKNTLIWETRDGNVIAVDGHPVIRDSTKYVIEKQRGVRESLVIHNLTLADDTEYCCYDLYQTDVKDRSTLTVLVRPQLMNMTTPNGPVNEGSEISLQCLADGGKPLPDIRWYMIDATGTTAEIIGSVNDLLYANDTGRRTSTLKFNVTRSHYNSTFICNISVAVFYEESFSYALEVQLLPGPPVILGFDGIYDENETLHVACTSTGSKPTANIMWMLNGTYVRDFEVVVIPQKNGTSTVTSYFRGKLSREMNGSVLTCGVTNSVTAQLNRPVLTTNVTLTTSYLPNITVEGNSLVTSRSGDNVMFRFRISARPEPYVVELLLNGNRLNTSLYKIENQTYSSTFSVTLSNVSKSYSGQYRLSATNRLGTVNSSSVELRVLYVPTCVTSSVQKLAIRVNRTTHLLCRMSAFPSDVVMTWRYRHTRNVISTAPARKSNNSKEEVIGEANVAVESLLQYTHTFVECYGNNSVGISIEPCIFQLVQSGPPDPPSNCTIIYRNLDVRFICQPSFDGGSTQTFSLQMLVKTDFKSVLNQSVPDFSLQQFIVGGNSTVRICSVNADYPDMYSCTPSFEAFQNGVSSDPTEAEDVNTAAFIAGGLVAFIGLLVITAIIIFILKKKQKNDAKRKDILKALGVIDPQTERSFCDSECKQERKPVSSPCVISRSIIRAVEDKETTQVDGNKIIASTPCKAKHNIIHKHKNDKHHGLHISDVVTQLNCFGTRNKDCVDLDKNNLSSDIELSPIVKPRQRNCTTESTKKNNVTENISRCDKDDITIISNECNFENGYSEADIANVLDKTERGKKSVILGNTEMDNMHKLLQSMSELPQIGMLTLNVDYSAADIVSVLDKCNDAEPVYDEPRNITIVPHSAAQNTFDEAGNRVVSNLEIHTTHLVTCRSETNAKFVLGRSNSFPSRLRQIKHTNTVLRPSISKWKSEHAASLRKIHRSRSCQSINNVTEFPTSCPVDLDKITSIRQNSAGSSNEVLHSACDVNRSMNVRGNLTNVTVVPKDCADAFLYPEILNDQHREESVRLTTVGSHKELVDELDNDQAFVDRVENAFVIKRSHTDSSDNNNIVEDTE